ncbi:MAG: hypothetical protein LBB75_00770 [Oscillospiraceae bacterium]|jgi:hypothetical protein|nr:hypothetical protein [Oscillospiraceae bacterium]
MALTKRVLAIALALVLGLGLLIPAAADDPNAPVITMQPKAEKATVQLGKELKLEALAQLPDGAKGTLSYAWYAYVTWAPEIDTTLRPIATGAKVSIPVTQEMIGFGDTAALASGGPFYVVVTNTYTDGKGKTQKAYAESEPVFITLFPGYRVIPAVIGDMLTWKVPWSYFLFPFVLLPGLFRAVFEETRCYIASLF